MTIGTALARWLQLAVLLLAAGSVHAEDTDAARAFSQANLPRIIAAFPDAEVAPEPGDPLQINITRKGAGEPGIINLHGAYSFCRTAPEKECAEQVQRLIDVIAGEPQAPAPAVQLLRIIVRDAQYWDYTRKAMPAAAPVHRQIGEDLFAILAFDRPQSIALALPKDLAELGLSEENAWNFAARQTARIIPSAPTPIEGAEGLTVFEGEEYVGSMLAYPERWAALAEANGPDLAVIANSDQFVIVSLVPDGPELARFRDFADRQCQLAPRCISPNVYRWREGRWVIAR